jgi:HEAT repeat protein
MPRSDGPEGGPWEPSATDVTVVRNLEHLARPETAAGEILRLGPKALDPLRRYLEGPAQSVPDARRLAASLLGQLGGPEAIEGLRRVLLRDDPENLDPMLALSEFVVRNEAAHQLAHLEGERAIPDLLDAFRRHQRPAAAEALGGLHAAAAIPALVAALENDLVVGTAIEVLRTFGAEAESALRATLRDRHVGPSGKEPRVSLQRRLRAALLLGEIGSPLSLVCLQEGLRDAHPALRAAAAWALHRIAPDGCPDGCFASILQGGFLPDTDLRARCQATARVLGPEAVPAAFAALSLETMPDLYGVPLPLSWRDKAWLVSLILEHLPHPSVGVETLIQHCDDWILAGGLAQVDRALDGAVVDRLLAHPDLRVREALVAALGRMGGPDAARRLLILLNDGHSRIRLAARNAAQGLLIRDPALLHQVRSSGLGPRSSWLQRFRVRRLLRSCRPFPGTTRE